MKTFTIHKYTDLMQDVYSLLDFNFFFSQFSFPDNTFFFNICYEKVAPKGIFSHSEKKWISLNAAEY